MKKRKINVGVIVAGFCALVMVVTTTGCSTLSPKSSTKSSPASSASTTTAATTAQPAVKENAPVYHDFGDIMVPRELSVIKKDSLIMTSGGVTSGILVLKGSVDVDSLANFFENKMPVDGWRKMGSFRSARSILLFEKPTRWCVIAISEGNFSTKVEIWVAPMDNQQTDTGLTR